jgi:hypothetical protein
MSFDKGEFLDPAGFDPILITQDGPTIEWTNYWESRQQAIGVMYCAPWRVDEPPPKQGVLRMFLPRSMKSSLGIMRKAPHAVLSRGPYADMCAPDAVEVMFEVDRRAPWVIIMGPCHFLGGVIPDESGREWKLAVWTEKDGKPYLSLERACYWRRVPSLPCARPWILRG